MIKCVAFDLDGVVILSDASFELFEGHHGITREDFRQFFAGPYRMAMTGACDLYDVLPEALREWGWTSTTDHFVDVWFNSCCNCDPDIVQEIVRLQTLGIRCCLATNQDNRRAAFLDGLQQLRDLFPERFFSCELRAAKPDARYFQHVQASLGFSADEILFVDDKQENVEGAIACGWKSAVCRNAKDLRRILSVHDLGAE
jgi:putative hydrolase of the HAD superfamily